MTYNGSQKFKSTFGGMISTIIVLLLIMLFGYKLNEMVQRSGTQVKKNALVNASNSLTPPINLIDQNVSVAFMLSNFNGEGAWDEPKYGSFKLLQ